jgi:transposase
MNAEVRFMWFFKEGQAMKVTLHSYARMPEALWRRLRRLIPKWRPSPKGGRPALDPHRVADGIYYILRTGCQWKAAPREYGSGSALHNYFQKWTRHGVFRKLWKQGLVEYDHRKGIHWTWLTLDTELHKAPLGGEKNREKPYRPRQAGCQTLGADRRLGRGAWVGHRRSQRP